MTNTAEKIVDDTTETAASVGGIDTGDLAKNMVDLVSEKNAFRASALVLKTADQMVGTLLDILDTQPKS